MGIGYCVVSNPPYVTVFIISSVSVVQNARVACNMTSPANSAAPPDMAASRSIRLGIVQEISNANAAHRSMATPWVSLTIRRSVSSCPAICNAVDLGLVSSRSKSPDLTMFPKESNPLVAPSAIAKEMFTSPCRNATSYSCHPSKLPKRSKSKSMAMNSSPLCIRCPNVIIA